MRLSRRYARLCLLISAVGIFCIPVGMLIGGPIAPIVGIGVFLILYMLATGIQAHTLRCPFCGKAVLPAKWSSQTPVTCPKCGRKILWDC